MRAVASFALPAAESTTIRTGLEGYGSACDLASPPARSRKRKQHQANWAPLPYPYMLPSPFVTRIILANAVAFTLYGAPSQERTIMRSPHVLAGSRSPA